MDHRLEFPRPPQAPCSPRADADDADKIQALGFDSSGTLSGKAKLRMYWGKALTLPGACGYLIIIFISPDSIVVFYENERGAGMYASICGSMRKERSRRLRQSSQRIKRTLRE